MYPLDYDKSGMLQLRFTRYVNDKEKTPNDIIELSQSSIIRKEFFYGL